MVDLKGSAKGIGYRWVVVGSCFVMVFTCLGFCSSNKGLYLVAITEALDLRRSLFSINDSCRFVATAVVNLFFGSLIARFGARKLIAAGFASLIASSLIYAWADHILAFYLGGAAAAQIMSPIIYREGTLFGYRSAYRLTAVILLVVGALVLLLFREAPQGDSDAAPAQAHGHKKGRGAAWEGIPFERARRKPWFYAAAVCVFLTGMALHSVVGVASAHMKDVGMDTAYVATVLSFHALALAASKFLAGICYDRFGLRVTMTVCQGVAVGTMFMLAAMTDSPTGRVLAMLYGVFSSLSLPLESIMLPLIASDLFGEKSFAKVMGLFVSFNTAGYALGAPVINLAYDLLGTYRPVLYVLGGMMAAVTVCFQFILRAAGRERQLVPQGS